MKDLFDKIMTWIKSNVLMAALIGLVVIVVFFGSKVKRLLFGSSRRRRRRNPVTRSVTRTRSRRSLPRSVGTRANGKGYPAAGGGYIPFKYNKDGTIKKAWQVGGTVAAKSRMSRLRKAK